MKTKDLEKILTTINDVDYKGSGKFIGAYINKEDEASLILLSLSKGVSKSTLVRNAILELLIPQNVIKGVSDRMFHLFEMKATPWSDFSPRMFKVYIEKELRNKGIRPSLISDIFKKFDKLVEKRK